MSLNSDHRRFTNIVKGKIRQNLREYIGKTDLFGRQGEKSVTIPMPHIELPRFRFGEKGGVGMGDGEIGDPLHQEPGKEKDKAGNQEGEHSLEIDVSLEELADMLGNELGLPNIEPRGEDKIISEKYRVRGIASVGPETLRSFPRGYRRALKRQISERTYDPQNPIVIPVREDMRYKTLERVPSPVSNAVIIYLMDVSGSMGEKEKKLVRTTSFWLSTWIRRFYKGVEERYIIHDTKAKEVDRETFFHTKESGGTAFAPAYHLCQEIIAREYDPNAFNIYPFHFSDGDNWGEDDSKNAFSLLEKHLLPAVNMFGYGQCKGEGQDEGRFLKEIQNYFRLVETSAIVSSKIRATKIYQQEEIVDALRHFLRTGR